MGHRRPHRHAQYLVTQEDLDRIDNLLGSLNRFVTALIESGQLPDQRASSSACDEFEAHIEKLLTENDREHQMEFPWAESDLMNF